MEGSCQCLNSVNCTTSQCRTRCPGCNLMTDICIQAFISCLLCRTTFFTPPVFVGRYAYPGDSPLRHASNAGQRAGTVLLCLLHLRHCWGAAVGWAATEPLLHGRRCQNVSCYSNRQMSAHQEAVMVPSADHLYCFCCYSEEVINICNGPTFSSPGPFPGFCESLARDSTLFCLSACYGILCRS